jgi:multiple sugar transport system permease protein
MKKKDIKSLLTGLLFLGPNIAGFLVFVFLPIIASFCISFTEWDILTPPKFIGLSNYIKLIQDKDFWYYLYNTLFFMLGIPIGMIFSLFLAILVNQKLKGIIIFRTIYFLPVISSMVACALVWRWIYNADFGLLNSFLRMVGIKNPPAWLASTTWAKPALIIMGIWNGAGYNMLLYLAALQSIPEELYEAASIDGANGWQKFIHITLPGLNFVNFFIIIMSIIGGFQTFGIQYVMTGGGPAGATTTIVYYIYNNAYQWFKMGYATAIAWVLFLLMLGATLLQWRLGKERMMVNY